MIKHMVPLFVFGAAFLAQAAAPVSTPAFHVDVIGQGKPMILIPGFASSGKTWDGTVAHYKAQYQCHVLTLAGFAGEPRIDAPFLETVRKELAAYIRKNKLDKPIVVGHSLGGFVALWLATKDPDVVGKLIIVDSLPFLAAVMNPAATAEGMKPMAENMRKMYSGPANEQSEKMAEMSIKAMVTKPEDFEMIMGWGRKSDRVAMGDAMYDMMTIDLRGELNKITAPTLLIGTWQGYKAYATEEQVTATFRAQYAKLKDYQFVMSENTLHFVMLDDPQWFLQTTDSYLGAGQAPGSGR